mgnify:CR=1 FL=1
MVRVRVFFFNDTAATEIYTLSLHGALPICYMGHVTICRVTLPQGSKFTRPAEQNFVDKFVWDRLELLGIQPSELCDDATFLRRVSLDLTGTLPSFEQAREFLEDKSTDKRAKLIDRLFDTRSEEHSLNSSHVVISYAVFCLNNNNYLLLQTFYDLL